MAAELLMGSTDAEHLSIRVLGREHSGAEDYWDGNWVISTISVAVSGFTAHVRASLRMDEIHRFNEGLKFMNQNLFGTAVLESMEDWINLSVKAASRGQLEVSGEISGGASVGNCLTFEFAGWDQTYLDAWIRSLDDMERAYPVIGKQ